MDVRFNNALTAGPALREMLLSSQEVKGYVGERIFPVISLEDETPPFIAYRRMSVEEVLIADGPGPRSAIFEFQIYSAGWEESLLIANAVVNVLGGQRSRVIRKCSLVNATETYTDENQCYVQVLDFKVKTTN